LLSAVVVVLLLVSLNERASLSVWLHLT
jgi:hypothetical protein